MPHSTLKLQPGVDQNRTIALNEAAISYSQLIRFVPDKQGLGLVQKLGGWVRYFTYNVGSIVRALWAWEDTNANKYLALGAENRLVTITALSANGTYVTISYNNPNVIFSTNDTIVIAGVTPTAYNGTYPVFSATSNSVTFASTTVGAMTVAGTMAAGDALSIIADNSRIVITPRDEVFNVAPSIETQAGSPFVVISCPNSKINNYDTVYIKTQISVGGLILFGLYPTIFVDGLDFFKLQAVDSLGNEVLATSTVSPGAGAVPTFGFTNGSALVDVTLANHGYEAGDTFTILIPLTSSGVTLYGNYIISEITSVNAFKIGASNSATATATVPLNGGNAYFDFFKTPGAIPAALGYGIGTYGGGGYGTGVTPTFSAGNPINATDWTLDNWGEILVATKVGGPIFTWAPLTGVERASIITNASPLNDGSFVAMPQQQIIAWGATFTGIQDPLLIRWCDVGDYNQWIALPTNQAGSYRLPKGSRIVGCIQGPQQGLVWTDLAVWAMQYVGLPYVYQFNEIGTGCGLIARKAATSMNGIVYWMGQSQFYRLGPNGVEPIQCPVWDVIFQDIDKTNLDRIRVAANSRFGEISWFYPTLSNGGEPSAYVKYNVVLNQWDFGTLTRTAWINESVLGPPIGAGPTIPPDEENFIYQHETSQDADGSPMVSSFQTGYFQIAEAEWKVFVDQVWPDMKWGYYQGAQDADLTITFYVTDYPGNTPTTYGPYSFNVQTEYLTPRFRGRLMSIKMESSDIQSFWRIGATRYRFSQDGKF